MQKTDGSAWVCYLMFRFRNCLYGTFLAADEYLARYGVNVKESTMVFRQGSDTDNLSKVFWEIDKSSGDLNSIYVGGLAITSIERKIKIDNNSDEIIFV